mmetsp:Transcript_11165/g.35620  ORF Transcript_11165/g.35620 Transcript_11165/m.35620 type:complete len:260 (-) Transcript_11165:1815-2594(-)
MAGKTLGEIMHELEDVPAREQRTALVKSLPRYPVDPDGWGDGELHSPAPHMRHGSVTEAVGALLQRHRDDAGPEAEQAATQLVRELPCLLGEVALKPLCSELAKLAPDIPRNELIVALQPFRTVGGYTIVMGDEPFTECSDASSSVASDAEEAPKPPAKWIRWLQRLKSGFGPPKKAQWNHQVAFDRLGVPDRTTMSLLQDASFQHRQHSTGLVNLGRLKAHLRSVDAPPELRQLFESFVDDERLTWTELSVQLQMPSG